MNSLVTQTDLGQPSPTLFPGLNSSALAHHGFLVEHSLDAQKRYEALAGIEAKVGFYPPIYFVGHGPAPRSQFSMRSPSAYASIRQMGISSLLCGRTVCRVLGNTALTDAIDTWLLQRLICNFELRPQESPVLCCHLRIFRIALQLPRRVKRLKPYLWIFAFS
jgi:hypothetical protein